MKVTPGYALGGQTICFSYLDHNDGAVIEVLHTKCEKIECSGNIKESGEPRYIGEFVPARPVQFAGRVVAAALIVFMPTLFFVLSLFWMRGPNDHIIISVFFGGHLVWAGKSILPIFSYLKFPRWSISKG